MVFGRKSKTDDEDEVLNASTQKPPNPNHWRPGQPTINQTATTTTTTSPGSIDYAATYYGNANSAIGNRTPSRPGSRVSSIGSISMAKLEEGATQTDGRRSRSGRRPSRSRTRELGGIREHEFAGMGLDGRTIVPWYCSWWQICYRVLTCCFPSCCLRKCGRMPDERVQMAWREKVALCCLITILCLALGFLTFGLTLFVCRPPTKPIYRIGMVRERIDGDNRWFIINGRIYNVPDKYKPYKHKGGFNPYEIFAARDLTPFFPYTPSCATVGVTHKFRCKMPGVDKTFCHGPRILKDMEYIADVAYDWKDIHGTTKFVYNGRVYDLGVYLEQIDPLSMIYPFGAELDSIFRQIAGRDGTKLMMGVKPEMWACLEEHFRAGYLEVKSFGCLITDVVLYVSLVCILGLVLAKFFLAIAFSFIMGKRLGKPTEGRTKPEPSMEELSNSSLPSLQSTPSSHSLGSNTSLNQLSHQASSSKLGLKKSRYGAARSRQFKKLPAQVPATVAQLDSTNSTTHMYAILLVTCYSEGELGLRTTLDSLVATEYDDMQKLILVIADGLITGSGNDRSTPDCLVDMVDLAHDRFEDWHFDAQGRPHPYSYVAVGEGAKRHNQARVYAGYYRSGGHCAPVILVVKCGAGEEEWRSAKPGNRGKRDSQIILMNFLNKCLFDDRMSPLEYDLFFKIYRLTGILPDHYEVVLMVDADTRVAPTSLDRLCRVMRDDRMVMGLCGETRIANKGASWVSAIQVFEYYISHHSSKAFESVFGGVTCLPGCFCMYRIKAPRGEGANGQTLWTPLLASPDIIDHYSESQVDSLHKKNLLLLGEDRYLTTLMLKTFPKRKLLFVPQAICKTVVPDTFSVLLSQRRRWINSTIHNLFELVLVNDLCGTFCCSMQFVVFMELVGTLVLPAAISFTVILIVSTFLTVPQIIPLLLLAAILGLPALLILFTTLNPMYVIWFLIYIVALPIWNFVLPLYAFWHFDDFSWGQTRQLAGGGDKKDAHGHGDGGGNFDSSLLQMRRWHEWEKERLTRMSRETVHRMGRNDLKPLVCPLAQDRWNAQTQKLMSFDHIPEPEPEPEITTTAGEEIIKSSVVTPMSLGDYSPIDIQFAPPTPSSSVMMTGATPRSALRSASLATTPNHLPHTPLDYGTPRTISPSELGLDKPPAISPADLLAQQQNKERRNVRRASTPDGLGSRGSMSRASQASRGSASRGTTSRASLASKTPRVISPIRSDVAINAPSLAQPPPPSQTAETEEGEEVNKRRFFFWKSRK